MSDDSKKDVAAQPKLKTEVEPKTGAEMKAMRKSRNFWVLGLIMGLAVLFYLVTILRMAGAT